jgi:hypothetical protein
MKFLNSKIIFLVTFLFALGCSKNILSELSSHSSDAAYLQDAQTSINRQDYQTAVDIITLKLSAGGRNSIAAKELLAQGYAGLCGLNFIDFVTALSTAGAVSAFKLLTIPFEGKAVDPSQCLAALNTLDSIAPSAARSTNDNAFAAIVGMSLMGTGIRSTTDIIPINGDGTPDAASIACTLTDPQIDKVILGLGFMAQNFSALSGVSIGVGSTNSLNGFLTECASVAPGGCAFTDPAAITNPLRVTMRDFLNTSDYGIGTYLISGDNTRIPGACP